MEQTTLRTFAILVSTSDRNEWFQSKEDLPSPIREQMESSLRSSDSFTFLLADQNGREELVKALSGSPSQLGIRYTNKESNTKYPARKVTFASPDSSAAEGIGLVHMMRRITIGLSLAILVALFLLLTKILSR
jgi:hypothetical protein